jgi:lysophospholipase L1-like esterase
MGSDGIPNDSLFVKDKLHLNREGYKLWGKIIKENFDKNLSL